MKKILVAGLVVLLAVSTLALVGSARNANEHGGGGARIEANGEGLLIYVPAKERVKEVNDYNNDKNQHPVINNPIEVAGS